MPINDAKEDRGFLTLTEAPSGDRQEDFRTVGKALHGFQWEESGQLTMNSSGKAGEYWVGPFLERLSLHPGWLPVFREILLERPSPGLNPEGYREEVLSMVTAEWVRIMPDDAVPHVLGLLEHPVLRGAGLRVLSDFVCGGRYSLPPELAARLGPLAEGAASMSDEETLELLQTLFCLETPESERMIRHIEDRLPPGHALSRADLSSYRSL